MRADHGDAEHRSARRADVSASRVSRATPASTPAQSTGHANQYQLFVERPSRWPAGRAPRARAAVGSCGRPRQRRAAQDAHGRVCCRVTRRLRESRQTLSHSSQRQVRPPHGDARRATTRIRCRLGERDCLCWSDATPVTTKRVARTGPAHAGAARTALRTRPGHPRSAFPTRSHDRRTGGRVLPFPRRSSRLARPLRQGAERDRRSVALRPAGQGLPVVEGKQIEPFRVRRQEAATAFLRGSARPCSATVTGGHGWPTAMWRAPPTA